MNTEPFLSTIYNKKTDETFIGLIQIISKNYISYYSVNELRPQDKSIFISMVKNWWKNEPSIPISLYYKDVFNKFNYILHYLSTNDYNILNGFSGINLKNMLEKRIKRKLIHLEDKYENNRIYKKV